uniref:Uncharacterized protein n=1 Tax=Sphaerodactylus townsendi TaxID=933632 RepID=A0ACB8FEA3_9SAUR
MTTTASQKGINWQAQFLPSGQAELFHSPSLRTTDPLVVVSLKSAGLACTLITLWMSPTGRNACGPFPQNTRDRKVKNYLITFLSLNARKHLDAGFSEEF